jgi:Zn finger protein HypA/HybF involved in hydrogenase expression
MTSTEGKMNNQKVKFLSYKIDGGLVEYIKVIKDDNKYTAFYTGNGMNFIGNAIFDMAFEEENGDIFVLELRKNLKKQNKLFRHDVYVECTNCFNKQKITYPIGVDSNQHIRDNNFLVHCHKCSSKNWRYIGMEENKYEK